MIRSLPLFPLVLLAAASAACSLHQNPDGSLGVTPKVASTSAPVDRTADAEWNGEPIVIDDEAGNVEVIGEDDRTRVAVHMVADAMADEGDAPSMNAALADVTSTFTFARGDDGAYHVGCKKPLVDHGSAPRDLSFCNVRVKVPARGLAIEATTGIGDVFAQHLAAAPGRTLAFHGGTFTGWDLTGSVDVDMYFEADAEVTPTPGAEVSLRVWTWKQLGGDRTGHDDKANSGATLRLPASFAADAITMSSAQGVVDTSAFPDVTPNAAFGRGVPGTGAARVLLQADWGDARLLPLEEGVSRTRSTSW